MSLIPTDYKCPLDGFSLSLDWNNGIDNDAYLCSHCRRIYPTLSKKEADILKDMDSIALLELEKYKNRLEGIKEEEEKIIKIFEFTSKSGLLERFIQKNKANLSEEEFLKKAINPERAKAILEKLLSILPTNSQLIQNSQK